MPESPRPSFARHVLLLWQLRATLGLNQRRHRVAAVIAYALSVAPAVPLGLLAYALMRTPTIADSDPWSMFVLNLLCFVVAAVFVLWPLLSAGVDDHAELSRYAAYPLSGVRLLFAASFASVFEPRALVILSPLLGAVLAFTRAHPPDSWALAALLLGLYVACCAGWARALVHLVLNVLRQRRSAELIGGFFAGVLGLAALIPPVDTRWLRALNTQGLHALDMKVIADAARALGRFPTGLLGSGLAALATGQLGRVVFKSAVLAVFAGAGFTLAYRWLLAFYKLRDRGGRRSGAGQRRNVFAVTHRLAATLFAREALDLWHNPRARLLAAVPFLLAILFRLLSGRDLVIYLAGATADAWIVGALCLYAAVVMGSTFSQNAFGYDGHGLALLLASPLDPRAVLVAKNRIHALAAFALALAVSGFVAIYFRTLHVLDWACALAAVLGLIPALLTAGNFLSVLFPVRFHADLERRDRVPFTAAMLGVAAAGLGAAPFTLALRAADRSGPTPVTLAWLAVAAAGAWLLYVALLPLALRLLVERREQVLQAVTRA